jgi:hypothetical protein
MRQGIKQSSERNLQAANKHRKTCFITPYHRKEQLKVKTYIYRCSKKPDTYIYLADKDDFSKLPEEIINSLGIIEFSMELDLNAEKKLAKENPAAVLENLKTHGFHIQLPDDTTVEALMAEIAQK